MEIVAMGIKQAEDLRAEGERRVGWRNRGTVEA
jgi:hypothetical protein